MPTPTKEVELAALFDKDLRKFTEELKKSSGILSKANMKTYRYTYINIKLYLAISYRGLKYAHTRFSQLANFILHGVYVVHLYSISVQLRFTIGIYLLSTGNGVIFENYCRNLYIQRD